jgi:hypothetical protein
MSWFLLWYPNCECTLPFMNQNHFLYKCKPLMRFDINQNHLLNNAGLHFRSKKNQSHLWNKCRKYKSLLKSQINHAHLFNNASFHLGLKKNKTNFEINVSLHSSFKYITLKYKITISKKRGGNLIVCHVHRHLG